MVFNMDGWSVAYCIQYEMASRGIAISTCTCNSVWNTIMLQHLYYARIEWAMGNVLFRMYMISSKTLLKRCVSIIQSALESLVDFKIACTNCPFQIPTQGMTRRNETII